MKDREMVVRTIVSGPVVEKIRFLRTHQKQSRSGKKVHIPADKAKKCRSNLAAAQKRLARLMNANFRPGDYHLILNYSSAGHHKLEEYIAAHPFPIKPSGDPEADRREQLRLAAARELRLCIRKVKRSLGPDGCRLKYIAITSDSTRTGDAARIHHHLVINSEALDAFRAHWGNRGEAKARMLSNPDYSALAVYFLAQVRHVADAKKYVSSRNLLRPEPVDEVVETESDPLPPGVREVERSETCFGYLYIRYYRPPNSKPNKKTGTPVKPTSRGAIGKCSS